jgi:hypothetical protein
MLRHIVYGWRKHTDTVATSFCLVEHIMLNHRAEESAANIPFIFFSANCCPKWQKILFSLFGLPIKFTLNFNADAVVGSERKRKTATESNVYAKQLHEITGIIQVTPSIAYFHLTGNISAGGHVNNQVLEQY